MARIAVIGGSGHVGSVVTRTLMSKGHTPRVVSRHTRRAGVPDSAEWATVDYRSGAGLPAALAGVDAAVLTVGGMTDTAVVRAVAAASPAELHLVYLSIVGIDRLPMSYYRAKLAAEGVITASGRPWTILRATQFHSLAWSLLTALSVTPPVMFVPRMRLQPVGVPDVGARLAELATEAPQGMAPEFGGSEVLDLADLARRYLTARGRRRRLVRFSVPGGLGRGLAAGANLTPDHADGAETFADYAARRA